MPKVTDEKYTSDKEMSKIVAREAGLTIKNTITMREAENEIVKALLRRGKSVPIIGIGMFTLREHSAKKGREFKVPSTGEMMYLEPKPEYQSVKFNFTKNFVEAVRKATKRKADQSCFNDLDEFDDIEFDEFEDYDEYDMEFDVSDEDAFMSYEEYDIEDEEYEVDEQW